jgi:hypothetical protein
MEQGDYSLQVACMHVRANARLASGDDPRDRVVLMWQGIKKGPIACQNGRTLTQTQSRAQKHEHCLPEDAPETGCDQVRMALVFMGCDNFAAYHRQITSIEGGSRGNRARKFNFAPAINGAC